MRVAAQIGCSSFLAASVLAPGWLFGSCVVLIAVLLQIHGLCELGKEDLYVTL